MTPQQQAEIISEFMFPVQHLIDHPECASPWWPLRYRSFNPILCVCGGIERLGWLHLVEEKLSGEQWERYWLLLKDSVYSGGADIIQRGLIYASAEQKVAALAQVLGGSK